MLDSNNLAAPRVDGTLLALERDCNPIEIDVSRGDFNGRGFDVMAHDGRNLDETYTLKFCDASSTVNSGSRC